MFCLHYLISPDVVHVLLQWTFHPFIFKSKKIYTVLIWCRVLAFLVVSDGYALLPILFHVFLLNFYFTHSDLWECWLKWQHAFINRIWQLESPHSCYCLLQTCQFLRILTFYSTQLPGPNYHCREVGWLFIG